jgi:hypothetical protein
MVDYNQFQVGGVVHPLSTSSANSLLQDADPVLFYALDFWAYVINTYEGPRLLQALTAAGITAPQGRPITSAVMATYPYEPLPEYLEHQMRLPFLAAYRTDVQTEWETVGWEVDSTALEVLYCLPPLDAAGAERILPILNAIKQALRRKTTDAWDPGYTPPGGVLGDQFDSAPYANVEEIGFGEDRRRTGGLLRMGQHGWLQGVGDLHFPTLRLRAYVRERDAYNPTQGGPSKFAGADITGNVLADDGTRVLATSSAVVQASTQGPPTIASLSVTSGTSLGGTSTTLTGTLFLSGPPQVYFGPATDPQYAASVSYGSSTSLTVTTPAMQGAGTVDVTVVNRGGQAATLKQAFTFT